MPFGKKNVEATYQRITAMLFYDVIHKLMKVYVDDMVIKSTIREGQFEASEKFLQLVVEHKEHPSFTLQNSYS